MFRAIRNLWKILMGGQPHKMPVEYPDVGSDLTPAVRKHISKIWVIDEFKRLESKHDLKVGDRVLVGSNFGECTFAQGNYCAVQYDSNGFAESFHKRDVVRVCDPKAPLKIGDIVLYFGKYYEIIGKLPEKGFWDIRGMIKLDREDVHENYLIKAFDGHVLAYNHPVFEAVCALIYPKKS